jgi:hypothetical protein
VSLAFLTLVARPAGAGEAAYDDEQHIYYQIPISMTNKLVRLPERCYLPLPVTQLFTTYLTGSNTRIQNICRTLALEGKD